jgi:hypothetical protein
MLENRKSLPFCRGFSRIGKTDSSALALEFRLRNVDLLIFVVSI